MLTNTETIVEVDPIRLKVFLETYKEYGENTFKSIEMNEKTRLNLIHRLVDTGALSKFENLFEYESYPIIINDNLDFGMVQLI